MDVPPQANFTLTTHDKTLNYHNGKVVSGKPQDLISLLVPTHDYYPEPNYIFTFLLCVRLFMPPVQVLQKVADMVEKSIEEDSEHRKEIAKNFMLLLVEWSENFPFDFKCKNMMKEFGRCSKICTNVKPALTSSVNMITKFLVRKFQELLTYVEVSKEFHIQCDEEDKQLSDVCRDPVEFAENLTILEVEKLSQIGAEQFVEKFIAQDMTCSQLDLTSTATISCLELYVAWFNRLSYLIATEISMCPIKKNRVKLVNFFIEVGKCCFKKANFNSLMAIIVGLNMNAVARMRKTWLKANQSLFKKLEHEMSPESNFRRYRDTLNERLKNRHKDNVIPVFSILVKDIYFLNEGIKDRLPNDLINFEKFWQLSEQIKDVIFLKNKTCEYSKNEAIMDYLKNTPVCNDEGIYKSSFEVEPPETNFERARYKSVRIKVGNR